MTEKPTNQQNRSLLKLIGGGAILLGLVAWIVVGALILMDSTSTPPLPTPTTRLIIIHATINPPNSSQTAESVVLVTPQAETPTTEPLIPSQTPEAPTAIAALILPSATLDPNATTAVPPTVALSSSTPAISVTISENVIYMVITATPTEAGAIQPTAETIPATATSAGCTPPEGWVAYTVEDGDTLFGFQLGSDGQTNVDEIMKANCLTSKIIGIDQVIYLPPGVGDKSPKVDTSGGSGGTPLPVGLTRTANCPCTIVVREGWRLEQIASAVDGAPVGFTGGDFLAATGANAPNPPEFGFLGSRPGGKTMEGFMFPGTYALENSTTAVDFRNMLLSNFAANVNPQIQADLTSHGLTLWEAVNMASIIQREARDPNEQKMAASIFYNRMGRGMGLGTFVTLQYAFGQPGNWWPTVTRTMINSTTKYNTSKWRGLPPSPISNPGINALLSVAYPAQTDYLYMNAKCGGGGNYYARTYEEFLKGLDCD